MLGGPVMAANQMHGVGELDVDGIERTRPHHKDEDANKGGSELTDHRESPTELVRVTAS